MSFEEGAKAILDLYHGVQEPHEPIVLLPLLLLEREEIELVSEGNRERGCVKWINY